MNFKYSLTPDFLEKFVIPPDLVNLLERTKTIIRGQDPRYPNGFISDNVYVHTIRTIWIAREFFKDIAGLSMEKIERTLLIHDLPEIIVGDAPAVAVTDGVIQKVDDIKVAREMLNFEDFQLYLEFEKAADFLKGNIDEIPELNSLVAKVVDNVEGNLMFHAYLFKFRDDPRFSQIPETALLYTFNQLPKHLMSLMLLPDSQVRSRLIDLYEYQKDYVRTLWSKNWGQLPKSIRVEIDNTI